MWTGALHAGATSHNITVLAGYLFSHFLPFGEIAYRCNLVSTVFGALAVAEFYLLARRVANSTAVAAFSAVFLMVSHSMWWHATVAEDYAVNALFCVAILHCLVLFDDTGRRAWLDAAAALGGLAVFNHAQMGMWLPAVAVAGFLSPSPQRSRIASATRAVLWYAVGLLPFAAVFAKDAVEMGALGRAAGEAAGGEFTRLFFTITPGEAAAAGRLFLLQWGWPSIFLVYVLLGLHRLARAPAYRATAAAAAVAFAVNTSFFAFYPTWDKYAFLLPSFIILTFVGTVGLDKVWREHARTPRDRALVAALTAAFCVYPVWFFHELPRIAARSSLWSRYGVHELSRYTMLDGEYLGNPDKSGYRRIEDYVRRAFELLPRGSLVIDHISRTFFQFRYYQRYYGARPDLAFRLYVPSGLDVSRWPNGIPDRQVPAEIQAALPARHVFVTSIRMAGFADVASDLLGEGTTFVEVPLGPEASIFEARPASGVEMRSWLQEVDVGLDLDQPQAAHECCRFAARDAPRLGLVLRLRRRNPPTIVRVDWVDSRTGARREGRADKLPFDAPPVWIKPEAPLLPGDWMAEVVLFEQKVASVRFTID